MLVDDPFSDHGCRSSLILYYDDIVDGGNDNQDPQEISERKSGDGGDFLYWENGDQCTSAYPNDLSPGHENTDGHH